MVELVRRKDLTFDEAKIGGDAGMSGFIDEGGVSDWLESIFVNPRIERGDVDITDLLVGFCFVV